MERRGGGCQTESNQAPFVCLLVLFLHCPSIHHHTSILPISPTAVAWLAMDGNLRRMAIYAGWLVVVSISKRQAIPPAHTASPYSRTAHTAIRRSAMVWYGVNGDDGVVYIMHTSPLLQSTSHLPSPSLVGCGGGVSGM